MQFRPAFAVDDTDIAPIEDRTRGGIEVRIEGLWQDEIYDALENPAGNPFFILQRAGQGWISAIPHRGEPKWEPPRTMPVMRVWSKKKVTAISPEQLERVGDMPVPTFVEEVRKAKKNIDAYYAKKRPGRPPREITEQLDLIKLVVETAVEVMDVKPLLNAQRALSDFTSSIGLSPKAPEIRAKPVAKKPRRKVRKAPKPVAARAQLPKPAPASEPQKPVVHVQSPVSKRRREFDFA